MELRRKAYEYLSNWKKRKNHKPLIVEGLRQVGKSYIVFKFAKENYDNVIIFDFRSNKRLRELFTGDLDVDNIISSAQLYFLNQSFVPYKTLLIFEEIGDCPLARTSLKNFCLDGRYDVIATGSLLGVINYRHKRAAQIPVGYEEYLTMTSLDFEEFLWACGVNENNIETLKGHLLDFSEINLATALFYQQMVKNYIAVGGMPDAVIAFLENNNNYLEARKVQERLIQDYRADFGRFISDRGEESIDYRLQSDLNLIFDSIPKQLARETDLKKFKYSEVKKGGRSSQLEDGFTWLEKAGLVLRCFNVKSLTRPLTMNIEQTNFKAFIADLGLLMACYPISTLRDFLNEELDSRKGGIYENLAAVFISKAGLPLYYFSKGSEHIEIDFLIEGREGLILYEEKSTNGRMNASKAVMEGKTPYLAKTCYKIIQTNFGKGSFYISIPEYCAPFLLENIKKDLYVGLE